jgi:hypothetical protein
MCRSSDLKLSSCQGSGDGSLWWAAPDHDRGRCTTFRRTLVDELATPGTFGFGVHFADVVFGRVHHGVDRPAWRPVDD